MGGAWRLASAGRTTALSGDQLRGLLAILVRLREEIAAVRVLAVTGLPTPAMQIMRSISEDVDMALVVLLRPKVARQFAECRTPEAAGEFWKRHVAGGRAFRAVAEQLYRVGLDYSEHSSYARWRREVQVLLGAAVHTLLCRRRRFRGGRHRLPLLRHSAAAGAVRPTSLMLGQALRTDLAAALATADAAEAAMLRVALAGGEIVLDQMRWLTAADEPAGTVSSTRAGSVLGLTPAASLFSAIQRAARTRAPIEKSLPWAATISSAISASRRKNRSLLSSSGVNCAVMLVSLADHLNRCGGKVTTAASPSAVPRARCSPSADQSSAVTAAAPSWRTSSSSRRPSCITPTWPLA